MDTPRSCYHPSPIVREGEISNHNFAPIRIHGIITLVEKGKYNEFSIVHSKLLPFVSINNVHLNLAYFLKIIVQNILLKFS